MLSQVSTESKLIIMFSSNLERTKRTKKIIFQLIFFFRLMICYLFNLFVAMFLKG